MSGWRLLDASEVYISTNEQLFAHSFRIWFELETARYFKSTNSVSEHIVITGIRGVQVPAAHCSCGRRQYAQTRIVNTKKLSNELTENNQNSWGKSFLPQPISNYTVTGMVRGLGDLCRISCSQPCYLLKQQKSFRFERINMFANNRNILCCMKR